ncbi:hypothetical protein QEJ31_10400 [Pigmentibacter sp. JX0631]|uniref:hypothetical protein n=1 Tax=Pigmentibacter sp. JX0631 TaxID=2976982 RepID=UPI002468290E|nr:hypothetical protein [Pigmentibacter sp. JX0631]WGL58931.1 hypothetical protein QEJ31_10400 [Pigmentibacter sp. JX0631]
MSHLFLNQNYDRLKVFHRIKSLKDFIAFENRKIIFEDETFLKIKENVDIYKNKEQVRLKKIELLTKILEKIEIKMRFNNF